MKASTRMILATVSAVVLCASTSCGDEPEMETHGFVCVDLNQAMTADAGTFSDTAFVRIKFKYNSCLRDFYLKDHPEYRIDGEQGAMVFNHWLTRLCTEGASKPLDCTLEGIDSYSQSLNDQPPNEDYSLTVTYKMRSIGQVLGKRVLFGPLPLEDLTETCLPAVDIVNPGSVQGLDAGGGSLWQLQSFSNNPSSTRLDENNCIQANLDRG